MTDSNSIIRKRQEIVSKLTQARLEKGLSQAQLAEMVGTQRSNICRIENGGQNLSLDLLIKITDALGKDVSVLLEEKGVEMSNVYNLKLYDDILVTFSLEEKGLEGLVVEVLSYDESRKQGRNANESKCFYAGQTGDRCRLCAGRRKGTCQAGKTLSDRYGQKLCKGKRRFRGCSQHPG